MTPTFFRRVSVRLLQVAAALSLSALHLGARADLWAYVDEQGVTHFAAAQVNERYTLFFKDSDPNSFSLIDGSFGLVEDEEAGAADKRNGPAFVLPKRFVALEASQGYRAVQKHMQAAAKAHAVDYELLKAVIAAESGFDPAAVSPKGAVGLMQLLPTTAQQYGVEADKPDRRDRKGRLLPVRTVEQKLTDPQTNIQAGARYLAYLLKLFKGELSLALAAYNAGEGAVQRAGNKIPNYKETQGYVKTVMGLYEVFVAGPPQDGQGPLGGQRTSRNGGAWGSMVKPPETATAAADAARPLASAVGRIGNGMGGRVRVELGGLPQIPANTP
ncbi:MAG: lytic transglycosylase domain-containing protein [Ottowia sp.]|uniref:lytic transglycosylase domain-containing protein n=1 Tax=Ottowia sp. TaxID=1898956 RepID=UPI003C736FC8